MPVNEIEGFTALIKHNFLGSSHCDSRSTKSCTNTCFEDAGFGQALFHQGLLLGQKPRAVLLCGSRAVQLTAGRLPWMLGEMSQGDRYNILKSGRLEVIVSLLNLRKICWRILKIVKFKDRKSSYSQI